MREPGLGFAFVLAGAPGFEPGDGGIKIRCLTTWLRPTIVTSSVSGERTIVVTYHSGNGQIASRQGSFVAFRKP